MIDTQLQTTNANTPANWQEIATGAQIYRNELANAFFSDNYSKLIKRFIEKFRRQTTKKTYSTNLLKFFDYVQTIGAKLHELNSAHALAYFDNLLNVKKLGELTANNYLNTCKSFYKFLQAAGVYQNIFADVKPAERKQEFKHLAINQNETKQILSISTNLRDKAIIYLMIANGLRVCEIERANIGDLQPVDVYDDATGETMRRYVLNVQTKGRDAKDQIKPLLPEIYDLLINYIKAYRANAKQNEPLFIGIGNKQHGSRLSLRSIALIAKNHLRKIGLDNHKFSAHSLRHTCANLILDNGGTLEDVQKALNHSDPKTSQIYAKTRDNARHLLNAGEYRLRKFFTNE